MSDGPRILLAGGGSGGSATPVIAVAERLRDFNPSVELLFVGTHDGPERRLAESAGLAFVGVEAGKLRRYWDWRNLSDPWRIGRGFWQALRLVRAFRPMAAFGAGGFASVPPLAAAALTGCPLHVHQQDVLPGLANRLLQPLAREISVSLEASLDRFPRGRTTLTGNPVRPSVLRGDPERARRRFDLEPNVPLLLVTGGGTGALGLNRLVAQAAPSLLDHCQIVHLTGVGRAVPLRDLRPRYRQIGFVTDEMADLLAAATLVLSRAGLGTLSELTALGKPCILVPMPGSHQDANAAAFAERAAAPVVDQQGITAASLATLVLSLLRSDQRLAELATNIRTMMPADAASRLARDVLALAGP